MISPTRRVAYPLFEIYLGHVVEMQEAAEADLTVKLAAKYPAFNICKFLPCG